MLFHSIVSSSDIFCNMEEALPKTEFKNISGGKLEIMRTGGKRRIVRLYSTDPYMYLERKYMPYESFSDDRR